ncbi:iron complex outermembrane receptor protein [Luteibacter sp. Sphag1AF]|uniref:TonB-dependent receptor plug domain-containing protein n=1 Tax=Luteibacter sp. Sphag1AF TaxID=2587031 RepID=UPI00160A7B49|nr:TonB-dependent receptor [Luteibacter sp. Sphag1AF]MBB3228521.1 iron complex outermembrane receptor protein [Luteibacter sp. Sphag1AF]
MKHKTLTVAVRNIIAANVALTALFATPAFAQNQPIAQTASDSAPAQLEGMQVTGSLIKSSDKTGYNQVQTVTAKTIQESGAATVADYLRNNSANSGSSYNESTVLNQSPGATGMALRGLSVKYTLVLIDGQRAAPYGFASGGTDTFFDLNTLPLDAIDHIEIVKTGGVSEYGSDAIAGVVNIITKKDYQGVQVDGSVGGAQHGGQGTTNLSVLGGFGDLQKDRYNVTAALSYYRQSGISLAQRDITRSQDYSGLNGGFFAQPSSFWSTPEGPQALAQCGPGSTATPADNNLQTKSQGTVCSRNGADAQSLAAQAERRSLKVHADFKLSDYNIAFVDLWGSHNTTTLNSGLAGFGADALVPSLYHVAGTGYAPFAPTVDGTPLTYYFPGAQAVNTSSDFYRILAGARGSFTTPTWGDWDWAASYGHSESNATNAYTHQINAAVVQNYLNSVTMSTFDPATFNTLPGLFGTSRDHATSRLDSLDATLSTTNLFALPAGDVGIGFGAQFQHQSEYIGPGSLDFVNPYTQAVNGQRNVAAAYYQVDVPLLSTLSLSQSGRYDHYNDFGGVFSPRIALRYQPVEPLTFYASYNLGFRAPTLIELDGKGSVTYQAVGNQNINEYFVGNPDLQPEKTRNYNVGFQYSPTVNTDIGFDWYKINVSNVISQLNIVKEVEANPGQPFYALPYANMSYLHTEGFETTFRQAIPTHSGTFALSGDWAYVWHFKIPDSIVSDFAGNNGANDTVFGGALPRWKGNTDLSWTRSHWTTKLTWQYTGPYKQVIVAGSHAPSYSVYNMSVSYTGFPHWKLYANVDNLLNRAPPYDPVWTFTYRGYYDPSLYEFVGRFAQIGATYTF